MGNHDNQRDQNYVLDKMKDVMIKANKYQENLQINKEKAERVKDHAKEANETA